MNNLFNHIFFNGVMANFRQMLSGNNYRIYPHRFIVIILHRYLCLSIRSKVGDCSIFSNRSQFLCQSMSQINGKRHQFICFVRSISEHHTLITSSKLLLFTAPNLQCFCNSLCNVWRLSMNRRNYCNRIRIKPKAIVAVPNLSDCLTGN